MTWPFGPSAEELLTAASWMRGGGSAAKPVSRAQALRISTWWACLRLRADLISTMPIDVFRRLGGVQVEQTKPPVMLKPGGSDMSWVEFMEATQRDLDSVGNTFGIVTVKDGLGLPARIELQPAEACSVITEGRRKVAYRIDGKRYDDLTDVWHERQHVVSGSPVGLSPVAYAASALNPSLNAAEFAARWFSNSAVPAAHLRETNKTLGPGEAEWAKQRFRDSVEDGGLFVSGQNWEYKMLGVSARDSAFLEQNQATSVDVCRYLGVPGDMVDADDKSGSITYANITQRNLQLLIMNLGPAIVRRESSFDHGLLAPPRYCKLNTAALQRMDLKSRYEGYKVAVDGRWMPPSRILDLENQPPLTPEEKAEFAELFPSRQQQPDQQGVAS